MEKKKEKSTRVATLSINRIDFPLQIRRWTTIPRNEMDFSRAVRARFRDNHFFFSFSFFFSLFIVISLSESFFFFIILFLPSLLFSLSLSLIFFIKFEKFPRPHSFLINHTTWKIEAFNFYFVHYMHSPIYFSIYAEFTIRDVPIEIYIRDTRFRIFYEKLFLCSMVRIFFFVCVLYYRDYYFQTNFCNFFFNLRLCKMYDK